ncbi:MAG: hypothetical protein HYZ00_12360 [Candidatus Hydrogenedentes bacterium]|nr:hypothetical protein [Candidatus Hydrogenedentota bacterium]
MTELLLKALAEVNKLPDADQDAIAAWILAVMADEQAWADAFEATSDAQWDRMVEMVRRDMAAGGTDGAFRCNCP